MVSLCLCVAAVGSVGACHLVKVRGQSMEDTLSHGDYVVAVPRWLWTTFTPIAPGDVVVFQTPDAASLSVKRVQRVIDTCVSLQARRPPSATT